MALGECPRICPAGRFITRGGRSITNVGSMDTREPGRKVADLGAPVVCDLSVLRLPITA